MARSARTAALLAPLLALLACGTRLPDSRFGSDHPATPAPTSSSGAGGTDVGVTGDTITIGNIVSRSNPFDARAFVGPYYGVKAFVDDINRRGGINGRQLVLKTCDDLGSASQNVTCVHQLIDRDHVFALVSNGILTYGGAQIVNRDGVPDIGSQPIDVAYTQYHHLWDVAGESYPRNGTVGFNGVLDNGTEVYRYFKVANPDVPLTAGVVYYNQASSRRFGQAIASGLRREGYRVITAEVNFALPDYDSVVVRLKHAGVRYVYDAIDRGGNERLCRALDDNQLLPVAKVTTTQNWEASIRADYAGSPACRNTIYATGGSQNYDDRSIPAVAAFRSAMAREGWDTATTMSEWALEGWGGTHWFADAAASCGQDVTRACVEAYMARPAGYTADGLFIPRTFTVGSLGTGTHRSCLNVARWQDSANGGKGGWVSQVPDMTKNCFDVYSIPYRP